jgi:UV DNA damage endonuclease
MRIGYACLTVGVDETTIRTCRMASATQERLEEIVTANLAALNRILDYNAQNKIRMFRISSDIIPFASKESIVFPWQKLFVKELQALGKKARDNDIRLSMHPGQYTVLNSPHDHVVENAMRDLEYHCAFLDALKMDDTNKIILHIGGIYGDKPSAIERFKKQYKKLSSRIKHRLIIENDDTCYNAEEVLAMGEELAIPVVFDTLHHAINLSPKKRSEIAWITACGKTWKKQDGDQKIHYSQQAADKRPGSHSETINLPTFLAFFKSLSSHKLDIMLEVKDKNISALTCIQKVGR